MQTIKEQSLSSLTKDCLKETIGNAKKLLLEKDYKLGKGYCKYSQNNSSLLNEIIKKNICCLTNNIKKSIDGEEVEYTTTFTLNQDVVNLYGNKDPYSNEILYKLWLQRGNTGTMDDFLNAILVDDSVEWQEMNW